MNRIKKNRVLFNTSLALLRYNKSKNIIATIAIILTTLMFTSIFTIGFSMKTTMERERMRMVGGDFHLGFKNLDKEQVEKLYKHEDIKDSGLRQMIGFVNNLDFRGKNVEISHGNESYLDHSFIEIDQGHFPLDVKEVLIDRELLDKLGLENGLGKKINLEFSIVDSLTGQVIQEVKEEFTIGGVFKGDELASAKFIYVSRAYIDYLDIPKNNYNLNVFLDRNFNLDKEAEKIISESGLNVEDIDYGINWAYTMENLDGLTIGNIISIGFILLIISLTGYLIIYNIFNISAFLEIKTYGLMKAIGMTYRDLKKIILIQGLVIASWGIPLGSVLGYYLGRFIMPKIMNILTVKDGLALSTSPWIFIFTGLFSLFTIYISINKPGKKVARVSPLVAIREADISSNILKAKDYKINIGNLARINLRRTRSKLFLVVLSLSLSIVVLNSTMIFLGEPDLDKYLVDFINSDFVLADAEYFTYNYHLGLDEDLIDKIEADENFISGGRIYYNHSNIKKTSDEKAVSLYGMDREILAKQEAILALDGFKPENLAQGELILGVNDDKFDQVLNGSYKYKLGDKISLDLDDKSYKYELVAFIPYGLTNTSRAYNVSVEFDQDGREVATMDDILYIGKDDYFKIYQEPKTMVYQFDVEDQTSMKNFLEDLMKKNPEYAYDSREIRKGSLTNLLNLFFLIGGLMSFMMGLVGVLNYINVIISNIISRKKELELMQSIAMTQKELIKLLRMESLYYYGYTLIFGLVVSILMAEFAIKPLMDKIYFSSYKFSLRGGLFILLIFFIIAIFVPGLIYKEISKKTTV